MLTPHPAQQQFFRWPGLLIAALITCILVRLAVLNVFYTTGDMHDPGWMATIMWHNRWRLPGPPAFPGRYFAEHISLTMWLANALSFVVPLPKFDYYAACIAATHALFAAGVYRAWQLTESRFTAARSAVAILVALAAAFSGVGVVALGLPHPELAIPALALWFVIAVARRAYVAACCWLAACLLAREDAGLHVFLLLALWIAVLAWRQRAITRDIRWLSSFAIAALSYSVTLFLAKHVFFPAGNVFVRSYPGIPAWHHVTAPFILDRLHFYLTERTYLLLPMLLTFIWACIIRNPLLPLGYIAVLPWLLLSFLAIHDTPGTLSYYYAFPFWLSLAWPLVALRVWRDTSSHLTRRWPYALLLLVSIAGWQRDHLAIYPLLTSPAGDSPFLYNDTLRDRGRYQAFTDYFLANRPLFGPIALDEGTFGLLIDHADRSTWLELWPADSPPETMIYFIGGFEWQTRVRPLLRSHIYRCIYAVPGTRIQLAARNPLSEQLPVPMPLELIGMSPGAGC